MKTRAKLICVGVTPSMSDTSATATKYGEQVDFRTQYDAADTPEDNSFASATPSAEFSMLVTNESLYGQFEAGKAYYFDVTPCVQTAEIPPAVEPVAAAPAEPQPAPASPSAIKSAASTTLTTYGQKAVGLSFNPSGDDAVSTCKQGFATLIDQMNDLRSNSFSPEQKRLASIAITEAQTAQMWAVKALTWKD